MAASNPYFLAVRKGVGSMSCKGENLAMRGEGVFAEFILSPIFLILEFGVENRVENGLGVLRLKFGLGVGVLKLKFGDLAVEGPATGDGGFLGFLTLTVTNLSFTFIFLLGDFFFF